MKKFLTILIAVVLFYNASYSQGCVAIRSSGAVCTVHDAEEAKQPGWQLSLGYRYFKSDKHYKGDVYQEERLELNTEVINWQHSLDISVLRTFNDRWSLSIGLPVLANSRSSLYEHGRQSRHRTESMGIGDMRIVAYRWLLNPAKNLKGNLQLGMGLKLPTGDYNFQDFFYNVGDGGAKELRSVDQSIQLGDGGTGLITELNAYRSLSRKLSLYANGFYLFNPRVTNGTITYRSRANEAIMSVADQYMARLGANLGVSKKLTVFAGGRIEGIPSTDLIGSSEGFRRPGYVVSLEPGINLNFKNSLFFISVPVALERNRTQSYTDRENTKLTGSLVHGDAAFADYSVNVGFSVKL